MFFRISCIWNIIQTWLLARPFVYLSSFISQILDFLYWMVCIFIFMASQWKQRMDYFDDQHTITVPMINLVLNSCHIYLSRAQKSLKTQQINAWNVSHVLLYLGLKKVIPKIVPSILQPLQSWFCWSTSCPWNSSEAMN